MTDPSTPRGAEITCDKNRRPFAVGDVLKVLHYTSTRGKKHFMYKQITREDRIGPNRKECFYISPLNLKPGSGYYMAKDRGMLQHFEIVQGAYGDFKERKKVAKDDKK